MNQGKDNTKLKPLGQSQWSDEQARLMSPMLNNEGVGPIASNLFTTLVRYPKLYKRWSVFANHVLFKSSLSARDRELVILRVAWLCQAEYEWGQHVLIAKEAGLSDDTIAEVQLDLAQGFWSKSEVALLKAVNELHAADGISDETWDSLMEFYSEEQILDIIFAAGNYRMLATFMNSVGLVRDDGVPGF